VNGWAWFWIAFTAVGIGAELIALLRHPRGDTASEQVWGWLHVTPGKTTIRTAIMSWRTFAVAAVLLWLLFHFTLGWWT